MLTGKVHTISYFLFAVKSFTFFTDYLATVKLLGKFLLQLVYISVKQIFQI